MPFFSPRMVALIVLAGWASFLSIESLFRSGGFSQQPGLPDRLVRSGVSLGRRLPSPPAGPLPEGLVLLESADYGAVASPPVRLRRIGLLSSGPSVHLPVELIGPSLVGPDVHGRCVVLDKDGRILSEQTTAAAWRSWLESQRSSPLATLAWLAGFRPFRANTCLWESLP